MQRFSTQAFLLNLHSFTPLVAVVVSNGFLWKSYCDWLGGGARVTNYSGGARVNNYGGGARVNNYSGGTRVNNYSGATRVNNYGTDCSGATRVTNYDETLRDRNALADQ